VFHLRFICAHLRISPCEAPSRVMNPQMSQIDADSNVEAV